MQLLESPNEHAGHMTQVVVRRQADPRQALNQGLQGDAGFQASQRRTDAEVY